MIYVTSKLIDLTNNKSSHNFVPVECDPVPHCYDFNGVFVRMSCNV